MMDATVGVAPKSANNVRTTRSSLPAGAQVQSGVDLSLPVTDDGTASAALVLIDASPSGRACMTERADASPKDDVSPMPRLPFEAFSARDQIALNPDGKSERRPGALGARVVDPRALVRLALSRLL